MPHSTTDQLTPSCSITKGRRTASALPYLLPVISAHRLRVTQTTDHHLLGGFVNVEYVRLPGTKPQVRIGEQGRLLLVLQRAHLRFATVNGSPRIAVCRQARPGHEAVVLVLQATDSLGEKALNEAFARWAGFRAGTPAQPGVSRPHRHYTGLQHRRQARVLA